MSWSCSNIEKKKKPTKDKRYSEGIEMGSGKVSRKSGILCEWEILAKNTLTWTFTPYPLSCLFSLSLKLERTRSVKIIWETENLRRMTPLTRKVNPLTNEDYFSEGKSVTTQDCYQLPLRRVGTEETFESEIPRNPQACFPTHFMLPTDDGQE